MKKRNTKEMFFRELRNELTKYFSIHEVQEIMDDYKMFFEEKVRNELGDEEIIIELGEPNEIVQELVKDKVGNINIFRKMFSSNKAKKVLIGIWIVLMLIFIAVIERGYMTPAIGTVLTLLQIALFWYIFVYKWILVSGKESTKKNKPFQVNLFALISIMMVYYNLFLLRMFTIDWSKTPLLKKISPNEVGPFVQYQIFVTLIICFVFLYITMLRSTNDLIQLNSIFLFLSSIIILIALNSQLSNVDSMPAFRYYLSNQLVMYTVIILIFGIAKLLIYKKNREVLK